MGWFAVIKPAAFVPKKTRWHCAFCKVYIDSKMVYLFKKQPHHLVCYTIVQERAHG